MKTFLVVNAESANGQTGKRWPQISAQVGRTLGEFGYAFTERPMHAAQLARTAVEKGYQRVVAVGGDGTLNEVVNGLMYEGKALDSRVSVGLLSRGTGGDFRRTFGWDLDLARSVERLAQQDSRAFDVGRVDFVDALGRPQTRYFANVCSFGVSGLVDWEVNRTSKALGGRVSFLLGSTRAFLRYSDAPVELRLDDGPVMEMPITCVAVGNGKYFGGGMMVAPQADPSDGCFDVTVWSGFTLRDFTLKASTLFDGSHVRLSGTRTFRCRTLEARAASQVLLDVDGEQPGQLPCRMSILPGALQLCA